MKRRLLMGCAVFLLDVTTASAQGWSKGWLDVNFGAASSAQDEYESVRLRPLFGETAVGIATYSVPTGASFDIGGGYMFHPHVGLGVSLSGTAHEEHAGLGIGIPHPFVFNAEAIDATVTNGMLQRSEGAFHIQAMFVLAETPRFRLRAFGGPSYFAVEQDTITTIGYDQVYLIFSSANAVDITSYETEKSEASGWGFHGGVDVSAFFTRVVGVGFALRASRATVDLDDYGGSVEVKAGGVQFGGGLRLRF